MQKKNCKTCGYGGFTGTCTLSSCLFEEKKASRGISCKKCHHLITGLFCPNPDCFFFWNGQDINEKVSYHDS